MNQLRRISSNSGSGTCMMLRHVINSQCSRKYAVVKIPKPYKLHRLSESPSEHVTITRGDGLNMFKSMTSIRRMEDEIADLYKNKFIHGFCSMYSGSEACCVGIESAITRNDPVIAAYRIYGWCYARGISFEGIIAELLGRKTGCSNGKGGSIHMFTNNFYGGHGIVGAQVPLGVGLALALKYQGKRNASITVYGDGASNQGQIFEAFNMAKLLNLPVVFVCENNDYGMGTSATQSSANSSFYTRGDYIPGIYVDGMDVLAVRECTKFAKDYALKHGPIIMECHTYIYYGRKPDDPQTFKPNGEIQDVKNKSDPIMLLQNTLVETNLATEQELKAMDTKIKEEVKMVTAIVKKEPELPLEEMYTSVYVDQPKDHTFRGCDLVIDNKH